MRKRNPCRWLALFMSVVLLCGVLPSCKPKDKTTSSSGDSNEEDTTQMSAEYRNRLYEGIAKLEQADKGVETLVLAENGDRYTVTPDGNCEKTALETEVGLNKKSWSVMSVKQGGKLEISLDFSAQFQQDAAAPLFLEVQEVHNRATQTIGYTVEVNGREVYFRTYEQTSAGANNYFISIDRSLVGDPKAVKIAFVNRGEETFYLNRAWMYNDFFQLAEDEGIYQKMEINGLYKSVQAARQIDTQYPDDFTMYETGALLSIMYMNNSNADNAKSIDKIIDLTADVDFPIHIMPSRWWGGTANGPDGLGGYFSDLEYGQIVYNAAEQCYQTTIPNGWSNTYWTSMNHPHSNAVAAQRLTYLGKYLANSFSLNLVKQNKSLYPYSLYLEHGIGYWNISNLDGSDYSDFAVEAAKKDGVELKADGTLTDEEKIWLLKNMARYFDDEAIAVRDGYGKSAIEVVKGNVVYPEAQLYDNIYSHGVQCGLYPSNDNKKIGDWESGMGNNMWPSYEVYVFSDYRNYDYVLAHGKNAMANLEMTMINTAQFQKYIKDCYAAGGMFVTMFNQKKDGENAAIKAVDNLDDEKSQLLKHFDRYNLWVDYRGNYREDMLTNLDDYVESYEDIVLTGDGCIVPAKTGKPGVATYQLTNNGETFTNGLLFRLQAKVSGVSGNALEIYAGTNRNNLQKVDDFFNGSNVDFFNNNTERTYDLSSIANGKKEVYVQLRLKANDINNRVQVRMVKGEIPWGKTSGNANGYVPTLKENRLQSLWISQRAVTERAIDTYRNSIPEANVIAENAEALFESGLYKSAYKLLSGEQSMLLPARFTVDTSGRLGRYPVEVTAKKEGDVMVVDLLAAADAYYQFELYSDRALSADITFSQLPDGNYALTEDAGVYTLKKTAEDMENGIKAVDGKVTCTVQYQVAKSQKLASVEFTGKVVAAQSNDITMETQDVSISDYAHAITLSFASSVTYTRRADGSQETVKELPKAGDMATITLNENGMVTKIEAVYGSETGKVKSFTPPALVGGTYHTGIIEMESGNRYELSYGTKETKLETVALTGLVKQYDIKTVSAFLQPGDTVEIAYCPYTYKDSIKRAIKIVQPTKDLFYEDFEGDWRSKAVEVLNYTVGPIDNNNPKRCIYPSVNNTSASIDYKITNTVATESAAVEFRGRSIIDGANNTAFYVSTDNVNWTKVHVFESSNSGSDNFNNTRGFSITDQVKGQKTFYLKLETFTTNDTWASICQLRVRANA